VKSGRQERVQARKKTVKRRHGPRAVGCPATGQGPSCAEFLTSGQARHPKKPQWGQEYDPLLCEYTNHAPDDYLHRTGKLGMDGTIVRVDSLVPWLLGSLVPGRDKRKAGETALAATGEQPLKLQQQRSTDACYFSDHLQAPRLSRTATSAAPLNAECKADGEGHARVPSQLIELVLPQTGPNSKRPRPAHKTQPWRRQQPPSPVSCSRSRA
jgi:hypothetical protein